MDKGIKVSYWSFWRTCFQKMTCYLIAILEKEDITSHEYVVQQVTCMPYSLCICDIKGVSDM